MSTSAISRVSAGVPDGGRFTSTDHQETDEELDPGATCGVCGEASDQDEGVPCDGCLEDHCACGASLDDGEGYDGQCGGCADLSDPAEDDDLPRDEPVDGSKEWFTRIETSIADEVRRQRQDAVSYSLMVDDDDRHSYDSLVRISTGDGGRPGYVDTSGTPAAEAITELAEYDDDFGTLHPRTYGVAAEPSPTEPSSPSADLPATGFMSEDAARALAAANPKPKGPQPITDADKEIATTIYRQIGPIVAGNMDAKSRNAYAITTGVRMTNCRAGARKRVDVIVTLNSGDLYDVEVVSKPTLKADSKPVAKASNIHVSQLQGLMLKIGDGRSGEIAA